MSVLQAIPALLQLVQDEERAAKTLLEACGWMVKHGRCERAAILAGEPLRAIASAGVPLPERSDERLLAFARPHRASVQGAGGRTEVGAVVRCGGVSIATVYASGAAADAQFIQEAAMV